MTKVKFTTNINKELLEEIKIKAIKEGKNVNEIIENQLKKYLEEKDMTREMINILAEATEYNWIGIRGTYEEYKIGETLGTSYRWDYENDITTYGTEDQTELGGVSATDATTSNWANFFRDADDIEEMAEYIIKQKEINDAYGFPNQYLVASKSRNPYGYEENDEAEAILENAVVLMKF